MQLLRTVLAGLTLPRAVDGRLMLAVDISAWLRPDAAPSPDRWFCHVYGRGRNKDQLIPGWPYSFVAALEPGRTSWTQVLDAVRLGPDDDVTAVQVCPVVRRLVTAGQWRHGDPDVLVMFDAGYDLARLAFLLADMPVDVMGRLRSNRVFRLPAPPRAEGTIGRPVKHGGEFQFADTDTWPDADVSTLTDISRYGMASATGWDRLHPRLTRRAAWLDYDGDLPVLEGTLIRLVVDHLPSDSDPRPLWLWSSRVGASSAYVDRLWQMFLCRFGLEHSPSAGPCRGSERPQRPGQRAARHPRTRGS